MHRRARAATALPDFIFLVDSHHPDAAPPGPILDRTPAYRIPGFRSHHLSLDLTH